MMSWIKTAAICFLLVPPLRTHKDCTQHIRWGDLLEDLNSLSSRISHNCAQHYEQTHLCDPQKMLDMTELNEITIVDIIKKAESLYKKNENSQKFIDGLVYAHDTLLPCMHHSHNANHQPVSICFEKLETFLNNKKSHLRCAWEIVNAKTREILQRLENRTIKRHR